MKQKIKQFFSAFFIAVLVVASFASCKKDNVKKPVDYSKAPRKPAPASIAGEWIHTEVSSTNVEYNGHSVPAYIFGVTFHINADGTGWEAITSTVNTYTSSNKEDVNSDGTFEIDADGDNILFKYYPIQGEVWDNDHFSHALAAEKCYPATYISSTCTFGEDSRGVYFDVDSDGTRYYKK